MNANRSVILALLFCFVRTGWDLKPCKITLAKRIADVQADERKVKWFGVEGKRIKYSVKEQVY